MKKQIYSYILSLEIFLIGVYAVNTGVTAYRGSGWAVERLLVLAVGAGLSCTSLASLLPVTARLTGGREKMEAAAKYLMQAQAWCLLALAATELIVRVAIYNPPFRISKTNWAGDIPAEGSSVLWGREGYAVTHYEGWSEIRTPYKDNRTDNNIIVLGDSLTEGLQVWDDQKFASVMETTLRKEGYDLDVLNFGRSGLAMADHISWIPVYRFMFKPKAIVIQLGKSDFEESFQQGQFNYFVEQDGQLDLVHTYNFSSGFAQKARNRYYLVPQIEKVGYERFIQMQQNGDTAAMAGFAPLPAVPGNVPAPPKAKPGSANMEADSTKRIIQQMKMLVSAAKGTPVILLIMPLAPNISGDDIHTSDQEHESLKQILAGFEGVTVVDPLPELTALVATGRMPRGFFNSPPGVGHLNEYGNAVIGQVLAKAIEEVLK